MVSGYNVERKKNRVHVAPLVSQVTVGARKVSTPSGSKGHTLCGHSHRTCTRRGEVRDIDPSSIHLETEADDSSNPNAVEQETDSKTHISAQGIVR